MTLTRQGIDTANVNALFLMAVQLLEEVGKWAIQPASGYDIDLPPLHWHAELGNIWEDVDVTVWGCGRRGRGAMMVAALMHDACQMGVRISVGQTQAATMLDTDDDNHWMHLPDCFWACARYSQVYSQVTDEPTMEEAVLRVFLLAYLGLGDRD